MTFYIAFLVPSSSSQTRTVFGIKNIGNDLGISEVLCHSRCRTVKKGTSVACTISTATYNF